MEIKNSTFLYIFFLKQKLVARLKNSPFLRQKLKKAKVDRAPKLGSKAPIFGILAKEEAVLQSSLGLKLL